MTAEIASIRTASEAAAALHSTDPAALDARTLTAVTEVLRAAAELSRAQRPIVLHGPQSYPPPAVAPGTAAYGAHVRVPAPPARDETPATQPRSAWGERLMFFGCGVALAGVVGAMVATFAGVVWVPAVSAFGALLWPIGGAAVNRAERAERGR